MSDPVKAGPLTATELTALKAKATLHRETDPRAADELRLLLMIESRDSTIRSLTDVIDYMHAEIKRLKAKCGEA